MSYSDTSSVAGSMTSTASDSSATSVSTAAFDTPIDVSQAPAALFAQLLSGPLVSIRVGNGSETRAWSLHRNLLVYHSPVLAIRFGTSGVVEPDSPLVTQNFAASPFSSAKTRGNPQIRVESQANDLSFVLPETSPDAFALLVKWLYQGSLTAVSSLPSEEQWPYAFLCQQVYSLASSFRMPDLQNEAIDQFRLGCHTADLVPGADEIVMVYKSTEPGSELRKLVSKVAARQIMDPDDECSAASYRDCFADPDFSADLVDAIRKGVGGVLLDDPNEESGCVYHVHEPGSSCSSRGKGRRLMSGNGILKKKVTFQK